MSENTVFLHLTYITWHVKCRISIHVVINSKISLFLGLNSIPLHIYIYKTHLFSNHLSWALRLFPYLGYYKYCYNEHRGEKIYMIYIFERV